MTGAGAWKREKGVRLRGLRPPGGGAGAVAVVVVAGGMAVVVVSAQPVRTGGLALGARYPGSGASTRGARGEGRSGAGVRERRHWQVWFTSAGKAGHATAGLHFRRGSGRPHGAARVSRPILNALIPGSGASTRGSRGE